MGVHSLQETLGQAGPPGALRTRGSYSAEPLQPPKFPLQRQAGWLQIVCRQLFVDRLLVSSHQGSQDKEQTEGPAHLSHRGPCVLWEGMI